MTVSKKTSLVPPFYGMPVFPNPVWVQWHSPSRELGNVTGSSMSPALSGAGGMLAVAFLVRAVQNSLHIFVYYGLLPSPREEVKAPPLSLGLPAPSQWHSQSWTKAAWAMGAWAAQPHQGKGSPVTPGTQHSPIPALTHLHVNMISSFPVMCSYLL